MRTHGTKITISGEESDLSLTSEDGEGGNKEDDLLSSTYPTWSSRFKCLEAYVCLILGLTPALQHCNMIATHGVLAFGVYVAVTLTIGAPLVFVEILLGRFVMGNVAKVWSMCPLSKGVLVCLLGTTGFAIVTNNVYNAYIFKYMFSLLRGYIPWMECRKPWAKENCFVVRDNETTMIQCILQHSRSYCDKIDWESSGTQFWKYDTVNIVDINVVSLLIFYLALSTAIVTLINMKGYQSCEKAFKLLVYAPILISFVLTFVAYFSAEVLTSMRYFLTFEWARVYCWEIWLEAFEDTLSSLTLATLALTCVSSHGKFTDNILIDVLVVIFTFIFFPSFFVIPVMILSGSIVVRYSAAPIDKRVTLLRNKGEHSNVFIWMSEMVLQFPYPTVIWVFLFFLQILLMCLGTQAIMVLALGEALEGIFPKKKFLWIQIFLAGFSFLFGLSYLFFKIDFELPIESVILMNILLYTLTWQVFYGYKKFVDDCHFLLGYAPPIFWFRIIWICLIPLLLVVMGWKIYKRIPRKPLNYIVLIYVAIPLFIYFFAGLVQICRAIKKKKVGLNTEDHQKVLSVFVADPDWGPDNKVLKTSRTIFDARLINKEFIYRQELFKKPLMKPPDFSDQNVVQLL